MVKRGGREGCEKGDGAEKARQSADSSGYGFQTDDNGLNLLNVLVFAQDTNTGFCSSHGNSAVTGDFSLKTTKNRVLSPCYNA